MDREAFKHARSQCNTMYIDYYNDGLIAISCLVYRGFEYYIRRLIVVNLSSESQSTRNVRKLKLNLQYIKVNKYDKFK